MREERRGRRGGIARPIRAGEAGEEEVAPPPALPPATTVRRLGRGRAAPGSPHPSGPPHPGAPYVPSASSAPAGGSEWSPAGASPRCGDRGPEPGGVPTVAAAAVHRGRGSQFPFRSVLHGAT